ncbi:MAG: HEAT repeat domain-containing protein [Chloroflexota bacterium]
MRLFGPTSIDKLESKRGVAALVEALQGADPERAREAAAALGRLGDPAAGLALINALTDAGLRDAAAAALVAMGSKVVDILVMTLRQAHPDVRDASANSGVRVAIAGVLGHAGDQRAVEPLITALDDVPEVGLAAAEALGKLKDPRALEPLSRLAVPFGITAVEALGNLGDQRGTAVVVDWVMPDGPDGLVRSDPDEAAAAIRALGQLGPADLVMPVIDRISSHFPGQGTPYGDVIHDAMREAEASLGASVQ